MQMEHEKCLEIVFHFNAQIEPTLMYQSSEYVGKILSIEY